MSLLIFRDMFFIYVLFFFKQKTAYEMRISDWSSDVCSSDLEIRDPDAAREGTIIGDDRVEHAPVVIDQVHLVHGQHDVADAEQVREEAVPPRLGEHRSEEHTSELQ